MSDLKVTYRPIQSEREQAAYEAALDTLIYLAFRKIQEERDYQDAVNRGQEPFLLTALES